MDSSILEVQEALKSSNIQLTHQRFRVLEYLKRNRSHPTVDSIYKDLHMEIPTLSKTTVYNTLRILEEAGLVRVLTIEDNETRYDIQADDHGHFKCESCGTIYNFNVDFNQLKSEELEQFKVTDKNLYFQGICPNCLNE
jgi:Fe2+ or Zn2+ uptake regulation protein